MERHDEQFVYFRWLARRGRLGGWCSLMLEDRSTPELRAMSDAEFWPWAAERLAKFRAR